MFCLRWSNKKDLFAIFANIQINKSVFIKTVYQADTISLL